MKNCAIKIREYMESDFGRLCEIHDKARMQELSLAGLAEAFLPLKIAAEREGLFEYKLIIAELCGHVAGFAAYTADELAWLYVDTSYMRRGIASALMEAALLDMEEDVSIEVLAGNEPAIALYRSFGFESVEVLNGRMPGNEEFRVSVHLMKRK